MQVKIDYNPYKMQTSMWVDGIDVMDESKGAEYKDLRELIQQGTPLQTWIEPIKYQGWKGIVNALLGEDNNEAVNVTFSGRNIDYQDLQRAINAQNNKRDVPVPAQFTFKQEKVLDDKILARNIGSVVKELRSERFQKLVKERENSEALQKKYGQMDENYKQAINTEFEIVFAGIYSSGKSTILNVLMRHGVLPTSDATCTSKNCRICHDPSVGSGISLTAYSADGKAVVPKKTFSSDAECAAFFLTICPMNKKEQNPKYAAVDTIELGADLSHLYPESVSADKFKIVLIDTPGMNSSQSSRDGVNLHEKVALEAIGRPTKPMVVLCAEGGKTDDVSIGTFMREITHQSEKDKGGFNDRFLFLMNKSDDLKFQNSECLEERKNAFAEYLTDASRWGTSDKKDIEAASHFVPRIFPVSALVEWAVQDGAGQYRKEALKKDNFKRVIQSTYEAFRKNVTLYDDDNFCFARYCDIPEYRKQEVEAEFKQAVEDEDEDRAVHLQSGMNCVEIAIRDYIARYAYPIKVRALLESFQSILIEVDNVNQQFLKDLRKAEKTQGEKYTEREGVLDEKRNLGEKRKLLEKAEKDVEERKRKLAEVRFDGGKLSASVSAFRFEVGQNPTVRFFQENEGRPISTGQKTRAEVQQQINQLMRNLSEAFNTALNKVNDTLGTLQDDYENQLEEIFRYLTTAIRELQTAGVFDAKGYDFTRTVEWQENFANLDVGEFAQQVQESIRDRTTRTVYKINWKKDDYRESWNPFKKIVSLFMSDTIPEIEPVDGYYKVDDISERIGEYYIDLAEQTEQMTATATQFMCESKARVEALTSQLLDALKNFISEIQKRDRKITELSFNLAELKQEIADYQDTCAWLDALKQQLQGV